MHEGAKVSPRYKLFLDNGVVYFGEGVDGMVVRGSVCAEDRWYAKVEAFFQAFNQQRVPALQTMTQKFRGPCVTIVGGKGSTLCPHEGRTELCDQIFHIRNTDVVWRDLQQQWRQQVAVWQGAGVSILPGRSSRGNGREKHGNGSFDVWMREEKW